MMLFSAFVVFSSVGQGLDYRSVNTVKFNVKEGLAMSRVLDFCIDNDGFIWVTSERGVQVWDGTQFNNIDTLGKDYVRIIKHPESGIFAFNDNGVYWLNYQKEDFSHHPFSNDRRDVIPLDFVSDTFYFVYDQELIAISLDFKTITRKKATYDDNNRLIAGGLKHIKESRQAGYAYTQGDCFSALDRAFGYEADGACYFATKKGLKILSDEGVREIAYPEKIIPTSYVSRLRINEGKNILVGIQNRLFEYEVSTNTWSKEWLDMNNNPLLTTGYYDKIEEDEYGSIWGITVTEGLIKINRNEDFGYIGSKTAKKNFIKNIALDPSSDKIVVAGLNNGIIVFDTLGNYIRQLSINKVTNKPMNVTGVFNIGPGEYLFNEQRAHDIYSLKLSNGNAEMSTFYRKEREYLYYQSHVDFDAKTMYFGFDAIYKLDKPSNKLTVISNACRRNTSMAKYKDEVYSGCFEFILIYNTKDQTQEEIPVKGTQFVRGIAVLNDSLIAYTGDKGLHTVNRYTHQIKDLYTDGVGYNLAKDDNDNLWLGTDKGLICIKPNEEQIAFLPEDGIQNFEFNTNAIAMAASGKLYLGGISGITTFSPNKIELINRQPFLYIRNLKVNNETVWTNKTEDIEELLILEHDEKTIEINSGTLGKHNEFIYSYSLNEGAWIDNGSLSRITFSLSPGLYTVDIKAHPLLQMKNAATKRINLQIKKPWWNQTWFYLSSGLFLLISFGSIIYIWQRRKLVKSQEALKVKQKLSDERMKISRDLHDNIGSQLSYLTSSLDNLRYEISDVQTIEKIDDLKGYGKSIIQDLRNMIWVLHHDKIKVEDLHFKILDLIRFVQMANPSIKINYHFNGDEADDIDIDSIKAGHIFKMTQEVLHNGIKYSKAVELNLALSITQGTIQLSYKDSGVGFDQNKVGEKGFGLINLRTRTQEMDGSISINSARTQGVSISIHIPQNT